MTDLSPAAQAVLNATGRKTWYRNDDIAAALRAAADHLGSCNASTELLSIATELEGSGG